MMIKENDLFCPPSPEGKEKKIDEELRKIFYESDKAEYTCPDCKGHDFKEGPHGGLSVNIKCANPKCGSGFNVCPITRFIERIKI